jgi:hypothetical protein
MEEEKYIKEKQLSNQPQAIPAEELIILLGLLKSNICKITTTNDIHGT